MDKIIDPTLLASLVRNVYETVGLFNVIYITPTTTDERIILYSLWVSSGLKYRQRFSVVATTPESKAKLEEEAGVIRIMKETIENTALYKGLSEPSQIRIQRQLKKKNI